MFGSGSPKSILCAFGKGSSDGSPNSGGQLSSQKATWDLLHAAAGEVEKMKLNEEACRFNHHQGLLGLYPVTSPVKNSNPPDVGLHTQQSLSHQQLQILQVSRQHSSQLLWQVLVLAVALALVLTYSLVFRDVSVSDAEAATNDEAAEFPWFLPTAAK